MFLLFQPQQVFCLVDSLPNSEFIVSYIKNTKTKVQLFIHGTILLVIEIFEHLIKIFDKFDMAGKPRSSRILQWKKFGKKKNQSFKK